MRHALAALALLPACSLFAPAIEQVEVTAGPCGQWTAHVLAEGWYGDAELLVDGAPVHRWPLRGQLDVTETGVVEPGHKVEIQVRAGESFARQEVVTDPVVFAPSLMAEAGPPARVIGNVGASCALTGASAVGVVSPKGTVVKGALDAAGEVTLDLPPGLKAPYSVQVRAVTSSGAELPVGEVVVEAPLPASARDRDRDGYERDVDCDDNDAKVNPGASEGAVANRRDDDCDGVVDDGTTAFDDDGDGLSEDAGDCDDDDAHRRPGAPELPDCRDQNCDGVADEGVTLPQTDDAFEPNNDRGAAWDLHTARDGSFSRELRFVTSGPKDEEWVRFFSSDDMLDDWGIDVVAEQSPPGAVYQVELIGPGGLTTGRIDAEGGSVEVRGRVFSSDSGEYALRIQPVRVTTWCPAVFRVTSR